MPWLKRFPSWESPDTAFGFDSTFTFAVHIENSPKFVLVSFQSETRAKVPVIVAIADLPGPGRMSLLLRKLKLTSTFWISAEGIRRDTFTQILNDESLKALYRPKTSFAPLTKESNGLEVALSKLWGVQFPLLMFFVLMLIPISAEVESIRYFTT